METVMMAFNLIDAWPLWLQIAWMIVLGYVVYDRMILLSWQNRL